MRLTEALALVHDAVEAGEVAQLGDGLRGRAEERARALDAADGCGALLLPRGRLRAHVHLFQPCTHILIRRQQQLHTPIYEN